MELFHIHLIVPLIKDAAVFLSSSSSDRGSFFWTERTLSCTEQLTMIILLNGYMGCKITKSSIHHTV